MARKKKQTTKSTRDSVTLDSVFTGIANAIRAKGVSGTMTPPQMAQKISQIDGGGGGETISQDADVLFVDCDGNILHSYSAEEVASMTELPPLPYREGLMCQGWNRTLQELKSYVATYGQCDVGPTYITDDNLTKITITIPDAKHTSVSIVFTQNAANGVRVRFGDETGTGSMSATGTGQRTLSHTYAPAQYPATYVITLQVASGTMSLPGNLFAHSGTHKETNPIGAWNSMVKKVNIGNKVTSIGQYAFQNFYSLEELTISNSVTSIGNTSLQNCHSIKSVAIPSGVTSMGNYVFSSCESLSSVQFPQSVTSVGTNLMEYCSSLKRVSLPENITSLGNNAFHTCYSLKKVIVPNGVTSMGASVFLQCKSLEKVILPSNLTTVGNTMFSNCHTLQKAYLPDSLTTIGSSMFNACYSLREIRMPQGVQTIRENAFASCYGLETIDFSSAEQVPTLNSVNAFGSTPTTKQIIVPDNLLSSWKGTNNWSSGTNNIVNCIVGASEA